MRLLLISISIFISNQLLQYFGMGTGFSRFYLDDLLLFPILLSLVSYLESFRSDSCEVPIFYSVIGIIIFSLLFEVIIPQFDQRFTADYLDVIFYALGAVIYYLDRRL